MVVLTGATSGGGTVLRHGAGFYAADDEFVRRFLPFCAAGRDGGAPTLVRVEERKAELLRDALGDPGDVVFLRYDGEYPHAPGALRSVLDLCERHRPEPERPLRLLGELPSVAGLSADAWLRYEAAVNHVLADVPVHAVCAYDTRRISDAVRVRVLQTHDTLLTADGAEEPNPPQDPPQAFPAGRPNGFHDPAEAAPPAVELRDPTPAAARRALDRLAADTGLDRKSTDDLLIAVTEVLANALRHGRPPVLVRAWGAPGRVLAAVVDAGTGPEDPLVGLLPREPHPPEGGLGLWITHQLCPEVAMSRDDRGFTVRVAAGTPPSATPVTERA